MTDIDTMTPRYEIGTSNTTTATSSAPRYSPTLTDMLEITTRSRRYNQYIGLELVEEAQRGNHHNGNSISSPPNILGVKIEGRRLETESGFGGSTHTDVQPT